MTVTELTIEVEPGSELARLLDKANGAALVLVKDGVRYRVAPERASQEAGSQADSKPDPWVDYDPERLMAGVRSATGSITEEEAERIKAHIYAGREQGTRSSDRP